jgi:O-antigen ligase
LKEKPILGEFMYEFRVFGSTGSYMHNILSYWAEYGLISFLLIFVPYFIYFYKSYKYFRKYDDKTSKALFFSGIYITLIVLFSRSYTHMIFWVYFALNMSYVLKFEREIKKETLDKYICTY